MIGLPEEEIKWTTVREVVSCYEAHGVPLPHDVRGLAPRARIDTFDVAVSSLFVLLLFFWVLIIPL